MASWRLIYRFPNGLTGETITTNISELERFDRTPDGNCVEARFIGKDIGIRARDLVTLEVDTGLGFEPVWTGYAETPGAVNDLHNPAAFLLVGLKQRFFEIEFEEPALFGDDVGQMVRGLITQPKYRPAGVIYDEANIPNFNANMGDRYYTGESVGEIFDALAEAVGAVWGVNAQGEFFFRRKGNTQHTFIDGLNNTEIFFEPVNAAETVTKVTLEIPPMNFDNVVDKTYYDSFWDERKPLINPAFYVKVEDETRHPIYNAWKKITWPGGVPPYTSLGSYAVTSGRFTAPGNAHDNDPGSFASYNGSGVAGDVMNIGLRAIQLADGFQFRYTSTIDVDLRFNTFRYDAIPGGDVIDNNEVIFSFPPTDVPKNIVMLVPRDVRFDGRVGGSYTYESVLGFSATVAAGMAAGDVKLYMLRMLTLNQTTLQNIAASYLVAPRPYAARVVRTSEAILIPRPIVNLVMEGFNEEARAALYRVSITKDGGIENTVMIEQPADSDTVSQNYLDRTNRKKDIRRENKAVR